MEESEDFQGPVHIFNKILEENFQAGWLWHRPVIPGPWESEAGGFEFKASLVYRVSSRTASAI